MAEDFKVRLKQALELRGMRAVDLVEKTGIPKGAISYYLAGKSQPKADRIYIMARALDVNEAWLLGYDVTMQRPDERKKTDQLAKLIGRMRTDAEFFDAVAALDKLSGSKYDMAKQLLATLQE